MTEDFYIGEIFFGEYPPESAIWCNEKGNCHIAEREQTKDGIRQFEILENLQETEAERKQKLSMLSLTAADVERALYKAFGKDFDDIIAMVDVMNAQYGADIDVKALKIELKANNFYRGNAYISQIGAMLGISESQLDDFFASGDYTKLISDREI